MAKSTPEPSVDLAAITLTSKIPEFWVDSPRVWFYRIEAMLAPQKLSDDSRFDIVVSKLSKEAIQQVTDLLMDPPEGKKFDTLKVRLLTIYEESKNRQLQKLISEMDLGDQKPSQLLRRMRELAKEKIPDDTLKMMWQGHLPSPVRAVLAVTDSKDLDGLAVVADNVFETTRASHVSEVSQQQSNPSKETDLIMAEIAKLTLKIDQLERSKSRSSVRRVAFRPRLKEPLDHHRRGPIGLMFSRGCRVSAMRHRDLGIEQEKEQGDYEALRGAEPRPGAMWSASVFFLTQFVVCQFTTENPTTPSTEESQTVTTFYALSTGIVPAPVMLRLGNSTIDSTKAFKVPQPSQDPSTEKPLKVDMVPHVVLKNTYFDHDRKYGPSFEDAPDGNITKITVQLGEDAHLNCRISLLQDKTVSWVRRRGKDEMPELLTVGAVTYAADNRVTVARRYPGNWRLLIREVKPDDEGVYECQISTHPPRVSRTYLHINTPQVWVVDEAGAPLLEKYYEAESTLALLCRARHVETPALLTWLHEGRALNADTTRGGISVKTEQVPGGADSQLRLARVNSSDAGNYTCAVRGARSHTVSVHVLNAESLAELHAGSKSLHPSSVTTVISLLTVLWKTYTDEQRPPSPRRTTTLHLRSLVPRDFEDVVG
ncbi:unnamed protein product [Spodoptera exigua]|nr:unnamed protein product [Spodoptera exigua]